jgi:hypothetical protein
MPGKYELYQFKIGDVLTLKKNHPCGNNVWVVERVGQEIGIRCKKCMHFHIISRRPLEKSIKSVLPAKNPNIDENVPNVEM